MIILFDLDGTLIDSTDAIVNTFHHSFDVHETEHPSDEEIKALIGYPLDIMYGKLGIPQEKVWDYVATYKERYRKISTQQTQLLPFAHAEPILTALKEIGKQYKEVWMIGDTKLDLIAAKNANIHSIGVLSGYDSLETLQKYTEHIHEDALGAIKFLQEKR